MKKRLPNHNNLPSLFNLGLHRPLEPALLHWENFTYQRKKETLENPIKKSLKFTEFITLFWTLLETEAQIAIVNTKEEHTFFYANRLEGSGIICYEGPWTPGLWSNPLLKNPVPDVVILLSVRTAEHGSIMGELQNLKIPVINFSTEQSQWNQFLRPAVHEHQITHFYLEIIRYLLLSFPHQLTAVAHPSQILAEGIDLDLQIGRLITQSTKRIANIACCKFRWPRKNSVQKNLISLKKKKRYVFEQLKVRSFIHRIRP